MQDLNQQALEWATVRMEHRPASKTGLIPAKAFEHEQRFLTALSDQPPVLYWSLERGTDPYGYVALEGNYYWVPGSKREDVKLLCYAEHLKIYQQRNCVAEYPLPADGVKNWLFQPRRAAPAVYLPLSIASTVPSMRSSGFAPWAREAAAYVDYALQTAGIQRHRFLRELFALSRRVTPGGVRRGPCEALLPTA